MKLCPHCREPLEPDEVANELPMHRECGIRVVMGSADCISRGTHTIGTCDPDDPKLTKREAAKAAYRAWKLRGG